MFYKQIGHYLKSNLMEFLRKKISLARDSNPGPADFVLRFYSICLRPLESTESLKLMATNF